MYDQNIVQNLSITYMMYAHHHIRRQSSLKDILFYVRYRLDKL